MTLPTQSGGTEIIIPDDDIMNDLSFLNNSRQQKKPAIWADAMLLRTVLDATTAMALADRSGHIHDANPRFLKSFGVSQPDSPETYPEIFPMVLNPQNFLEIWQAALSGEMWQGEIEWRGDGGRGIWLASLLMPWLSDGGEPWVLVVSQEVGTLRARDEEDAIWLRSRFWMEQIQQRYLAQRRPAPVGVRGLSPREDQVLRFVAEGLANKNIAARLNISSRTVEIHRAHLMRKLGVKSTAALVKYAFEHGYLPSDA